MARSKPRYTHWTADTKTAFLMALRATGSVTRACAEIGRSVNSPYEHRRKDPDFDGKWRTALAEWEAEAIAERRAAVGADEERAMPNRARFDGFTPLRQRAFLRALSETGDVREACRKVQVSNNAAYKMREKYPTFATAWDRALAQSVATLEQAAFERAVDGVEEEVWHAGKRVGTRVRRSDALLGRMLARQDKKADGEAKAVAAAPRPYATKEETDAAILRKLEAIETRMVREAASGGQPTRSEFRCR